MEEAVHFPRLVRFGTFEVDLPAGELRKGGVKLKLTGQPFQVLTILLERPGEVVTRDELQKRLWPDTFVDVDHNLNTAINKIREVLGDSAESPRFVETLPRRGYRFVAPVNGAAALRAPEGARRSANEVGSGTKRGTGVRAWLVRSSIAFAVAVVLLGVAALVMHRNPTSPASVSQRTLTRLTFDEGLQIGATWSPDSRFIAYSSDRGGKFDIWVQQASGGNPVQVTHSQANNWQPDWSPDGKYIAYRSEDGEGGLFVIPALGGAGFERRIASFGYYPRWSPDGSQILFKRNFAVLDTSDRFYVVGLDGSVPRELFASFVSRYFPPPEFVARSAAWHPDGKRISIWAGRQEPSPTFWTLPVAGGGAVKSEIAPEIVQQFEQQSTGHGYHEFQDFRFSWAPSGNAIYFERSFRGARNIWRIAIDPQSLQTTALERLTTGPEMHTEFSLSPSGKQLAFTSEIRQVRAWMFPFDATLGRVTGPGRAVTSRGMEAWRENLSRDGKQLAFCARRAGNWELWEKSLPDGQEAPIMMDQYGRDMPQWSPDSTRLAYVRDHLLTHEGQIVVWSSSNRKEMALTTSRRADLLVYDWSPDSKWLLLWEMNKDTRRGEIWLLHAGTGPDAEVAARKIISDPGYSIYQPHFSPDGRWIAFEAIADSPKAAVSTINVMPAAGGPWTRISKGEDWDDKPRWSPDGKTIYFVSRQGGVFNVWGRRFDLISGKPAGEPFPVTAFENPALTIPADRIPFVELSLTQDKLVLSMEERTGSIWVLDNVGQ